MQNKKHYKLNVKEGPQKAVDFLAEKTELSKSLLKKLMINGAVWYQKKGQGKKNRLRKATTNLNHRDKLELYYDPKLTNLEIPQAQCILPEKQWGIWFKPAGMLSQGTKYGDQGSLLRQVEKEKQNAFLIHRLDREAQGLVVMAYTKKAASELSKMFVQNKVEKIYRILVLGEMQKKKGSITHQLDEKKSRTDYEVLKVKDGMSLVKVNLLTGRTHQIRRHFNMEGHPVMGDPRYGRKNKNEAGLMLAAVELGFTDPLSRKQIQVSLPEKLLPVELQ